MSGNEIAFRFEPIPQAAGGTPTTLIKLVWEGRARISFGSPPDKKSNSQRVELNLVVWRAR